MFAKTRKATGDLAQFSLRFPWNNTRSDGLSVLMSHVSVHPVVQVLHIGLSSILIVALFWLILATREQKPMMTTSNGSKILLNCWKITVIDSSIKVQMQLSKFYHLGQLDHDHLMLAKIHPFPELQPSLLDRSY